MASKKKPFARPGVKTRGDSKPTGGLSMGWVVAFVLGCFIAGQHVDMSSVWKWIPHVPIVNPVAVAPFPCNGEHVLIIEESGDRSKVTKDQLGALISSRIHAKIREVNPTTLLDGSYALRIWDKDKEDGELVQSVWAPAFANWKAKANGKTPWLIISNGKDGVSKELVSEDDTLALMDKYKL